MSSSAIAIAILTGFLISPSWRYRSSIYFGSYAGPPLLPVR